MQAFPGMRSVRDNTIVDQLRERMEARRSRRDHADGQDAR